MWSLFKIKDPRIIFPIHIIICSFAAFPDFKIKWQWFLLGMVYSNFIEYFNHKVIFHTIPKMFKNERVYFVMHGFHHKYPDRNPVTPLPQTMLLYILSYSLFRGISYHYTSLFCGGSFGFLVFEITHVFIHACERDGVNWPWLRPLIDFHLTHHFDSSCTYGFTSPFWDWLFGDLPKDSKYSWPIVPIPLPVIPFMISKAINMNGPLSKRQ